MWEFITNQSLVDTVSAFSEPLAACRTIIAEAYGLWLQFDVRTDDITMILAFIDTASNMNEEARACRSPKSN